MNNDHLYRTIDALCTELSATRKRLADEIKMSRSRDRAAAVYCNLLLDSIGPVIAENDEYRAVAAKYANQPINKLEEE